MSDHVTNHAVERALPRDQRQVMLVAWAARSFGHDETSSVPQRALRLLEEAVEAFQVAGGDRAIAHKFVDFVCDRPADSVGQERGGVAVTVHLLAAAVCLSADEEECRETRCVLSKRASEFSERNAKKNAAEFKIP